MKFCLIDRITRLQPGKSIVATKSLSLAEEYLQDHFPAFPVLPGVLMLEAMVQAGAWLVRVSEDFGHSMILLKEARNVSYGTFVAPGDTLQVCCEVLSLDQDSSSFKAVGQLNGQTAVKARLTLQHFNLADRYGQQWADVDARMKDQLRRQLRLLTGTLGPAVGADVPLQQSPAGR